MKASVVSPGTMMMQCAFSSRSCGIPLSGAAMISEKTDAASPNRLAGSLSAARNEVSWGAGVAKAFCFGGGCVVWQELLPSIRASSSAIAMAGLLGLATIVSLRPAGGSFAPELQAGDGLGLIRPDQHKGIARGEVFRPQLQDLFVVQLPVCLHLGQLRCGDDALPCAGIDDHRIPAVAFMLTGLESLVGFVGVTPDKDLKAALDVVLLDEQLDGLIEVTFEDLVARIK